MVAGMPAEYRLSDSLPPNHWRVNKANFVKDLCGFCESIHKRQLAAFDVL